MASTSSGTARSRPHPSKPVLVPAHARAPRQSYERFVFLPTVIEPFGRVVVEAWAAGCELVINDLVGARYWIEHDPDRIRTAGTDFWELVLM